MCENIFSKVGNGQREGAARKPSHLFLGGGMQVMGAPHAFGKKGDGVGDSHTCVAALGLGKEGVNDTHGGSKDVGRREAKGRASQRKHLRERRYSPAWWLVSDLGQDCAYRVEGTGCAGRREGQRQGDILGIKPNISSSHGGLGSLATCPPQPTPALHPSPYPAMEEPRGKSSPEWWR